MHKIYSQYRGFKICEFYTSSYLSFAHKYGFHFGSGINSYGGDNYNYGYGEGYLNGDGDGIYSCRIEISTLTTFQFE